MKPRSERSQKLASAVEKHLAAFLDALGFEARKYLHPLKVGVVGQYFVKEFPNDVKIEFEVWLQKTGYDSLHWRVGVTKAGKGYPGVPGEGLNLKIPYDDARFSGWTHTAEQFHPFASDENFDRAFEFIGTLVITLADDLVTVVPEFGPLVDAAKSLESWRRAPLRNAELWRNRLVRGQTFDMREEPATLVFVGANLVSLDCAGIRLTFKLDTAGVDENAEVRVSGWWTTPAGTKAATILKVGQREWHFNPNGSLANVAT